MKKSVFIIAAFIITVALLVSCGNDEKIDTKAVADFKVCVSEDLFEIADIFVDYSKVTSTNKALGENGNVGQKLTSSSFAFSYTGDDSEIDDVGLKMVVVLKDSYTTEKEPYDLSITLNATLIQKDISNSLKKEIDYSTLKNTSIDENSGKGGIYYFYYDLNEEYPSIKEEVPVDWSEKDTLATYDVKNFSGNCYIKMKSDANKTSGTVSAEFLNRLETKQNCYSYANYENYSEQADIYIIDGNGIGSLTDGDYSYIIELASRGGKIVLIDTNKTQFDTFFKKFIETATASTTDSSNFSDEFKIFLDRVSYVGADYVNFDSEDEIIGIIAICNSRLFIIEDEEPYDTTDGNDDVKSPYYARSSINYFISWLAEDYNEDIESAYETAKTTANGMSLDSLESAQIVDTTFSASAYKNWRGRSVPVHVRYYIWSAHNIDSGHDFYIVEQEVQAENNKWFCAVQNKNTWDKSTATPSGKTGSDWGSYGPYMAYLTMDNKIDSKGDTVVVSDYAPTTQSGSTSVSTGISFTLGGNIGLSGKGISGGGLNGSVTFNRSETVSIPEVRIEVVQDGANLKFKYLGADLGTHSRAFHWRTHDLAQGERVNAMEVKNRWIWDINNGNTNKTYKFSGRIALTSQCMEYHNGTFKWESWTYNRVSASTKTITLLPPSRFCTNYLLQAETPDDWSYAKKQAFQEFMVDKFENWYSNKNIYSPSGTDLDKMAKEYFEEAMDKIETNKNVIATAGYYGTFEFSIQDSNTGTELASQTLEVTKE